MFRECLRWEQNPQLLRRSRERGIPPKPAGKPDGRSRNLAVYRTAVGIVRQARAGGLEFSDARLGRTRIFQNLAVV